MPRLLPIVGMLLMLSSLSGCGSAAAEAGKGGRQPVPPRRQPVTAEDYVTDVVTAPTPAAEADAIRRLRQWEIDNGMTCTIKARRSSDYSAVQDPSTVREPLRAEVTFYRGLDPVRSFVFEPRDNRNLALFEE